MSNRTFIMAGISALFALCIGPTNVYSCIASQLLMPGSAFGSTRPLVKWWDPASIPLGHDETFAADDMTALTSARNVWENTNTEIGFDTGYGNVGFAELPADEAGLTHIKLDETTGYISTASYIELNDGLVWS